MEMAFFFIKKKLFYSIASELNRAHKSIWKYEIESKRKMYELARLLYFVSGS